MTAGNVTAAGFQSELSTLPKAYVAIKYAAHSVEALLIVVANTLTLLAVQKSNRLRVVATNTFITSLAASDGMIGVLLPFIIAAKFSADETVWDVSVCSLRGPYFAMFSISLSTLLTIAMDRYLAVVHPLYYRRRVSVRGARIVSTLIWIVELSAITALTCYYGTRSRARKLRPEAAGDLFPKVVSIWLLQFVILLPIAGNIVLYSCIYIKLRRKRSVGTRSSGHVFEQSRNQTPKNAKVFARMMILVLGYLVLAWLPYYLLAPMYNVSDPATPRWYIFLFDVAMVLFYSNSFMNPFIYSWNSRDFKEAYHRLLRCRSPSDVTEPVSANRISAN